MDFAGVRVTPTDKTVSIFLCLSILSLAPLILCQQVYAQGSTGRISGTITDQSGGVGAKVDVTNIERGPSWRQFLNQVVTGTGLALAGSAIPLV
jgi:hypothetical protein